MNTLFRLIFLTVCACLALNERLAAAETNSVSTPQETGVVTQSMVNGYLQIQAQLHDTQLAMESNRREAAEEAKRNADALAARIQTLEETLANQRANEVDMAQRNQQFTLLMAVAFGLI